ncbi:MAG: hypothetical protein KDD22_05280 [Bdellovibrionales bacterium]|nr:hypothetical protein [Bdellovibrionales bacterium]
MKIQKLIGFVVLSLVHVFGGKRESDAGGIVGLGGIAGDSVLGKGYTVKMKFRCI